MNATMTSSLYITAGGTLREEPGEIRNNTAPLDPNATMISQGHRAMREFTGYKTPGPQ